ncbi:hypothetical protein NL676_023010 [Syzygium grande]|nr:hypothetical protein NL676_023010 [Syzygium grande]
MRSSDQVGSERRRREWFPEATTGGAEAEGRRCAEVAVRALDATRNGLKYDAHILKGRKSGTRGHVLVIDWGGTR